MHISARCRDSHGELCQRIFCQFIKKFNINCEIDFGPSDDNGEPILYVYLDQELQQRNREEKPNDIFIAIQYCEPGVDPTMNAEQETEGKNFCILYSESQSQCYQCDMNENAQTGIKKWIKEIVKPYNEREKQYKMDCKTEPREEESLRCGNNSKAKILQVLEVTDGFCRVPFSSFANEFLPDISIEWKDDHHTLEVSKPVALLCSQTSRPGCDIEAMLQRKSIPDSIHPLLILIHFCEPGVPKDIPITKDLDDIITSVTNIVYSDSKRKCYKCTENKKAKQEIKEWLYKANT